jgi:hypothetical protein
MWGLWWIKGHWDRFFPKYFGKMEKTNYLHHRVETNYLHHRVAQYTLRLRCVRSICCGALHHKKKAVS